MQFKYRGIEATGKRVRGRVTAASLEEAKQKLRAQGLYYESLSPVREFGFRSLAVCSSFICHERLRTSGSFM